jgi:hypothetical protein
MPDCGFGRETARFHCIEISVTQHRAAFDAVIASGIALMPTIRLLHPTASSASMAPHRHDVVRRDDAIDARRRLSRPAIARGAGSR